MDSDGSSTKPRVLAEDEFKDTLSQIIQRDFFPSLPQLQNDPHVYEAENRINNDRTVVSLPNMTLNGFLSTHTTEDNASFRVILDTENAQRKRKNMTYQDTNNQTSRSMRSSAQLLVPEDSSKPLMSERSTNTGGRIVYENTRFSERSKLAYDQEEFDTDSESGDVSTPEINGYKMIKESPVTTRQRGFVIRPETPRERVAKEAGRTSETKKKPKTGGRVRKGTLSPAAQRLLMRKSGSGSPSLVFGSDAQSVDGGPHGMLRKNYNSPYFDRPI
ncbi:hypothetical protein H4R99_003792 [Coemansia sp. RSA 1722]|nr:hypothetical protein LPJ57_006161 [Coemansia sp. RSA 486]KAJ2222401.1 hypothetical protein IWW45_008615 [Coemansia sp. RSA 485]KAJ2599223.1 hypothetical protein H4R99_003792 [Coemansia sp. RSA 1722]KAJ2603138.1 hypothetical protein GGF39_000276 [Coemansia sp. RSA 1721]KAJ2639527.1 hypothetical protein GGF40_000769 [Coemansia sp. RSA 1286]